MSISIYYRPVKNGTYLDIGQSTVAADLELPRLFTKDDIPWITGYAAGSGRDMSALIDAIERHGTIDVFTKC